MVNLVGVSNIPENSIVILIEFYNKAGKTYVSERLHFIGDLIAAFPGLLRKGGPRSGREADRKRIR